MRRFESAAVAAAFEAYPAKVRQKLLFLRTLIFDTAARTDGVGAIEEVLRWGVPAYPNRGIVFNEDDAIPVKALADCVAAALTYHRGQRL